MKICKPHFRKELSRIKAMLATTEDRTDFIRAAVEREIRRRERQTVEDRAYGEDSPQE
jgi:hypothetical protein